MTTDNYWDYIRRKYEANKADAVKSLLMGQRWTNEEAEELIFLVRVGNAGRRSE